MDQLLRKWVDFPKLIPDKRPPTDQRGPAHKRQDRPSRHRIHATCEAAVLEYQRKRQAESRNERRRRIEQDPFYSTDAGIQPAEDDEPQFPGIERKLAVEEEIKGFESNLKKEQLPNYVFDNAVNVRAFLALLEKSFESPVGELLIVSEVHEIAGSFQDLIYMIEEMLERPIDDAIFTCIEDIFEQRDIIARHYSNRYAQRLRRLEEAKYDAEAENQRLRVYIEQLEGNRVRDGASREAESGPIGSLKERDTSNIATVKYFMNVRKCIVKRVEPRRGAVGYPGYGHGSGGVRSGHNPAQAPQQSWQAEECEPESEGISRVAFGRVVKMDEVGAVFDYGPFET